jgi:endonuclease/exonuclease/phosphatase family metal-dependent hydrolase
MRISFWISAASIILSSTSCAGGHSSDQANLTVLVYNIHAGKDAKGIDNLERVSQIIRDTKADIVLLQEVDRGTTRSGRVDQVARFEELTGFHGAFGKTLDYQGGDYGIAILSRWPIQHDTLIHLPVEPPQLRSGVSYEPRGALVVIIPSPIGKLRFVNTHLDPSRTDSFRVQEIKTVLKVAEKPPLGVASVPDIPRTTMVGGDFNSEPESAVHAAVVAAGWRDAFSECGKGSGLSYPDDKPVKRIDYLFMNDDVRCKVGRVLDTNASDHRPVLIQLYMRKFDRRFVEPMSNNPAN